MTPQELRYERIKAFRDCAGWNHPVRVPFLANVVTWKIIDAGYKFSEALHDYDIMEKCVRHFLDNYRADILTDYGIRNPMRIPESIGKSCYYANDDSETLGVHAYSICESSELSELAQDPDKFTWEKLLPRRFPGFENLKKEDFQRALDETLAFTNYTMKMSAVLQNEYGVPTMTSTKCGFPNAGIEEMFSMVRGIRGVSMDMRRNPEGLQACVDAYNAKNMAPVVKNILAAEPGPDPEACFDVGIMLLAHTVMNEKQWEKYYWPCLEPLLDACAEKQKSIRITCEGDIHRFYKYFAKYPKGIINLNLDEDDVLACREALPNVGIIGGITTAMLGSASPSEVVKRCEFLIDRMDAKNGGFMFGTDKFVSYRNDATPENMKALCDFCSDFRF